MKIIFAIIVIFFTITTLSSQNIASLDQKNGFRDFKFGDSFLKWKDKCQYNSKMSFNKDEPAYKYLGTDITEFGYKKITEIFLFFNNSKLIRIHIDFEPLTIPNAQKDIFAIYSPDKIYGIKNQLNNLFGEYTNEFMFETGNSSIYMWQWKGNKVLLSLAYENFGVSKCDIGWFMLEDNIYLKSNNKNGF